MQFVRPINILRVVHILWWTSNSVRPKFSNEYYKVDITLVKNIGAVYFTMESAQSPMMKMIKRARGDGMEPRDPV